MKEKIEASYQFDRANLSKRWLFKNEEGVFVFRTKRLDKETLQTCKFQTVFRPASLDALVLMYLTHFVHESEHIIKH